MAKVEYRKLPREKREALKDELCATLLRLPEKEDMVKLLCEFLTASEHVMLARRVQVAKRLLAGKTQLEIRIELGVGFPLIQNVEKWLESKLASSPAPITPEGKSKGRKGKREGLGDPYSFTSLRRQYPARMGLINFLLDA